MKLLRNTMAVDWQYLRFWTACTCLIWALVQAEIVLCYRSWLERLDVYWELIWQKNRFVILPEFLQINGSYRLAWQQSILNTTQRRLDTLHPMWSSRKGISKSSPSWGFKVTPLISLCTCCIINQSEKIVSDQIALSIYHQTRRLYWKKPIAHSNREEVCLPNWPSNESMMLIWHFKNFIFRMYILIGEYPRIWLNTKCYTANAWVALYIGTTSFIWQGKLVPCPLSIHLPFLFLL